MWKNRQNVVSGSPGAPKKMAVSDDDVIKRKLLIEGDGGNDDRRISSLLKQFIKWSNSTETAEESNATYQRMLSALSQCETAMDKSYLVHAMNLKEQENYDKLNSRIEKNIHEAYEKITECKNELHKAKRIRRNRQEYDALAKVIQQHPDRQETLKKLDALDEELKTCKDTKQSLERKLELRRKQFHVLITAIHGMQKILEDDDNIDDTEMDAS